ncbi:MAG: hypothetical protein HC913_10030 [Microscillaceae bacterium]|nr:hypothetical protein [Microscillaceae bacterium]
MTAQDLQLQLIQWILSIQDTQTLQSLWEWKEMKKQEREARFFALCGTWYSEQSGDELVQEIYDSRIDEPREVIL